MHDGCVSYRAKAILVQPIPEGMGAAVRFKLAPILGGILSVVLRF